MSEAVPLFELPAAATVGTATAPFRAGARSEIRWSASATISTGSGRGGHEAR